MDIPTEKEWENYKDDLDAKYAHGIFYGKSNDGVQKHFKRSVIERASELSFMPIKPFQYYVLGFKQFIEQGDFDKYEASDAASCFIRLIEDMLTKKPAYVKPVIKELLPTLKYVAENQSSFDASQEIYGDFKDIFNNIQVLVKNA